MKSIKEHPPQSDNSNNPIHVPVLLQTTLDKLKPRPGESYLDLTAGYGGHAGAFLQITDNYKNAVLVDRDINAINQLGEFAKKGAELIHDDFVKGAELLIRQGRKFDIILADLGVSSPQLDRAERGFSFMRNGPLDMRMDPRSETTAQQLVNELGKKELIRILMDYGEESFSRASRITEAILKNRPIKTTLELAEIIEQEIGRGGKKVHPATRTFQALRIEVNQELNLVARLLPLLPKLLNDGGRVGVISFHSLEDRLVKKYFANQAKSGYEAELLILEKKPIAGTEDVHNPRSRSAKFRFAVKK